VSTDRAIQLVEAGLWLRMSGDMEGARRLFEQALRLDPGCARARELLGTQPAAAEALPEELQHVPNSTTNLFAVPLPRLFPDEVKEPPEASTDPFMPLPPEGGAPSPLFPEPAKPSAAPPPARPTPPPRPLGATPAPFVRGTPLPAPIPKALLSPSQQEPGTRPAAARTPFPGPAPTGTPPPMAPALPLPSPRTAPTAPPGGADDWWTDGVSTPAPPPKDGWEMGRSRPTTLAQAEPAEGDALNLVAPLPASAGGTPLPKRMPSDPRREAQTLLQRASELQELDDHSGARELLLQAQALDPTSADVSRALAESEQTLQALYESKLGKLSLVPRVRLRDDEVIWLNLDHRAGFILAQIDGTLSFDDLFSVSGMSRLDTARILVQLLEQRVLVR
jgi:tetratricopeptide (TPR) repeat protein